MCFNAGKYVATSTNPENTEWSVESLDGLESFTLTQVPVGIVANKLLLLTRQAFLKKA